MNNLHGVGMKHITKGKFENIQIPLPPLAEQKRIVAKLDSLFENVDKAIELHQQNITNANTLMASTLDKTFKKLEGEYSKIALLDVMKISNKTLVPDDNQKYNYVGLENIEGNTGRLIDFCETQGKEIKSSKVEFKKGMVLYGKLRPYLNKVWFSEFDDVATTEILPFYPIDNTRLNMIFVKYYFLSSSYLQRVMRNCSGSRMPRLTTAFLKSEEAYIPLPPLPIQ
ncbi:restriction endonuclease subunit S [Francisella tularensis]|uniref:restriction endonuclease subunit S n=1 Tax=Francisella tularensis TaxID=263 RepID=UPI0005B4511B|nr:restriction endonuclease subunit S [Francisella tularensis]MBK2078742.1 restriction endonuclease subunit S [Francisella tularensis subsp. mediasiatica]MBK2101218.1 restriction endonuclease subunit S [Francisella tularensis subsp. mediasiatica]MBK2104845.1 restriction endonuclease subunit S [Francisella tularensis subsp. mediasiatica]MDN9003169.1 restriction endonuclease subunit S [Francisella tularensis subsp. mediasiatica]MDN9007000.1 restriction endonuclease subunit S [Francisella tularen